MFGCIIHLLSTPSFRIPTFSSTRPDALFSTSHTAHTRYISSWLNAQVIISSTASAIYPLPHSVFVSTYPRSALNLSMRTSTIPMSLPSSFRDNTHGYAEPSAQTERHLLRKLFVSFRLL